MKRPADQAKLLLFALLRGTATALATRGEKTSRLVLPATQSQNIRFRLANRSDVPSIQKCNLACLPENYNSHFYCSHLRQWPDLAIVAEHVVVTDSTSSTTSNENKRFLRSNDYNLNQQQQTTIRRPFPSFSSISSSSPYLEPNRKRQEQEQHKEVVAYVLGKIESRPVIDDPVTGQERVVSFGHVTSLAVQKEYRRLGLAKAMMTQLHSHLENQGVTTCGLHVRASNLAACKLYEEDGYQIHEIIPSYYQDGEDAYFMRKLLLDSTSSSTAVQSSSSSSPAAATSQALFGRKIWRTGPEELRLPRIHVAIPDDDSLLLGVDPGDNDSTATVTSDSSISATVSSSSSQEGSSSSSSPELLTGTM